MGSFSNRHNLIVRSVLGILAFFTITNAFALIGGIPLTPSDELSKSLVGVWVRHRGINDQTYCSGTLIAPKVVLTAAHCIEYDFQLEITVGFSNEPEKAIKQKNPLLTRVGHKAVMAEGYLDGRAKWEQKHFDVALVFLDTPAPDWTKPIKPVDPVLSEFPKVFTAAAAGKDLGTNSKAFMNSKRADFSILLDYPKYLLSHQIQAEDNDQLIEILQSAANSREKLFLAENNSNYQLAPGDSGSPALIKVGDQYKVLGVLSGPLTYMGWVFANFYVNLNEAEINRWIRSQISQ